MPLFETPLMMFMALLALYSPVAAMSSYFSIVRRLGPADQRRLAFGLFAYVVIFAMTALWIGEPLLELLGISTAALAFTGGIALIYVGVPLMRGTQEPTPQEPLDRADPGAQATSWRSVLFMPVTFPMTVGGTTFAILVGFRSRAENVSEVVALSIAGIAYAAVAGITVYLSGQVERRTSPRAQMLLERIAGILLTAIAVSLLASGGTQMVVAALEGLKH